MASIIYPNGTADITVAASSKLAVLSESPVNIYQQVGYANYPNSWTLLETTTANEQYITAAVTASTVFRVEAGPSQVLYEVGTSPNARDDVIVPQGSPTALTTSATVTIAQLLTGIITGTHTAGATQTYTLPTGTLTDAGVTMAIGDSFDWVLINLSAAAADTVTVAAGTDHTVVGSMVVASAHSTTGAVYGNAAQFRTRKTAANTFVTYRIA